MNNEIEEALNKLVNALTTKYPDNEVNLQYHVGTIVTPIPNSIPLYEEGDITIKIEVIKP